jgi:LysM repeat protein
MLRSPARLLAPLALVVCAIAILVIVNGQHSGGGSTTSKTTSGSSTTSTTAKARRKPKHHTYRVRQGDVLSQIAVKTGVPLDEIQRLNPKVDAQSLHAGQKIKLVP